MKKTLFIVAVSVAVATAGGLGYFVWNRTTQTPQSFFQSGKKYYEQKKYQEAMIQLLNAVRKDPRHKEARLLLSHIFAESGNLNRAEAQLKAILEYYPDDPTRNLELGNLYVSEGHRDPKLFRDAETLAKKVLTRDPDNVEALILSGMAQAGLRNFDASVDTLEKATTLDPQNPRAWISLGVTQTV